MGGIGNFSCKWVETGIGGVHNGEDEKFLKSVSMVSKRVLTPYFMKTPVYCQPFPLSPPTPTPTVLSVVLFLWLNGWSRHIWCAVLLNHIMDLWSMYGSNKPSNFSNQKDLDVCSMQQGVKFTEVWLIMRFFTGTLIWYCTHTQHTQGPVDWHSHINISSTCYVLTAATFITLNEIIHWYQKFSCQCLFFSKIIHL